jgi:RNA polymerase sigma-70 factor (ECF subfamily)
MTRNVHQAEDLTQETMLRAWKHRHRLRDQRKARVWLFTIAANLWRDQARRALRSHAQATPALEDRPDTNVSPDRQLMNRDDAKRAMDAMDRLPSRQREVIYLHTCESLSLEEVAEVLQISYNSVKSNLSLARRTMRRELEDLCTEHWLRDDLPL